MLTNMIQVLRIFNPVIAAVLLAFNYISILKNMELRNQHAEVANMVNRLQEDVLHLSKSVLKVQHSSEKIDVITHLTEKPSEIVYNIAFYAGIIILFAVMGAVAYNAFSAAKVTDSIEKSNGLNKDITKELLDRVSELAQANNTSIESEIDAIIGGIDMGSIPVPDFEALGFSRAAGTVAETAATVAGTAATVAGTTILTTSTMNTNTEAKTTEILRTGTSCETMTSSVSHTIRGGNFDTTSTNFPGEGRVLGREGSEQIHIADQQLAKVRAELAEAYEKYRSNRLNAHDVIYNQSIDTIEQGNRFANSFEIQINSSPINTDTYMQLHPNMNADNALSTITGVEVTRDEIQSLDNNIQEAFVRGFDHLINQPTHELERLRASI